MSKQGWSKAVPVEDGWYWINDGSEKIVYVKQEYAHGEKMDFPYYMEAGSPFYNGFSGNEKWLGPLTPPE